MRKVLEGQNSGGFRFPGSKINRRELVRRLLLGAGTGISLPAVAASHPVEKYLTDAAMFAETEAQAASTNWSPKFLDPHQNEMLSALAERLVPGSSLAHVNRLIDLLLSVDTQDQQKGFLASLAAFEAQALHRFSHPYKDLTEAQQNQILMAAFSEMQGNRAIETNEAAADRQVTLCDHMENLKGWVSRAYYSTEVGMKSLGWTGQVMFESFSGCQHPGGHQ